MAEIIHDEKEQKFYLPVENTEARLLYRPVEDDKMEIYSTFSPPEARGQGLAGKLVEKALDYAAEKNLKVIPTCSYVAHYFEKNPEKAHIKVSSI